MDRVAPPTIVIARPVAERWLHVLDGDYLKRGEGHGPRLCVDHPAEPCHAP